MKKVHKSYTPVADFIEEYIQDHPVRAHMPGHKGIAPTAKQDIIYSHDLTEITGADSLYEAEGILLQSEEIATSLFDSYHTYYSAGGSSQCIKTMCALACAYHYQNNTHRPTILAGRNAHKTFIHASQLLRFDIKWLESTDYDSLCECRITPAILEQTLSSLETIPCALYLTSPDYLGNILDIKAIAEICHQYHMILLVDNAHGAYLKFIDKPYIHPIDAGADLVSDSAHKTLPALTGAAYLHISQHAPQTLLKLASNIRDYSVMFGSTSPSYLILESMDHVNKWLIDHPDAYKHFVYKVSKLKQDIKALGFHLRESEPLKITLSVPHQGQSLMTDLTSHHIECEYADPDFVVLMLTPFNSDEDLSRIYDAFASLSHHEAYLRNETISMKTALPEVKYQPYELLFALEEEINVDENSIGHICVRCHIGCPPAILPIVPGEVINAQTITILKKYDIHTIHVLKNL
ncbi:MAG: aminotransferase class V-fold PLP-dependent enzyme [Sharpea porci]|uniref:aminotransferase class V-fold PLP-dependent enzyme n=1 Tax=Sharpea porci TaxID=2652286 RepID=UPI002409A490|nr:aminotransferase class V-fold PLP-dependent enzyme [Sharpea porci]MDD6712305.1 aminotransferase class V-fold PLP-dependent enzyme [Sharpea porci]